jgi:hypothetical protein
VQSSFLKEDEIVDQMYGRLTIIINELDSLGKAYITPERVRKILRCLPMSWRHIVTAITEAKYFTKLKLDDLIESLKAHESTLQEDKPMKKNMIALESLKNVLKMKFYVMMIFLKKMMKSYHSSLEEFKNY